MNNIKPIYLISGAVAIGAVFIYFKGIKGVASGVAQGAVDAVGGVAQGGVYGISDIIGLPNPSQTKCEQAKAKGNTWDASFYCSAGDFLKYLGN